jgi:serine/threonine-protein kinase
MAISRDGSFMVYSAFAGNPGPEAKPKLYLRQTDRTESTPIGGTEGGFSPFLSPDDRWVGFWADQKLKKVLLNGEGLTTICEMLMPFGASWGPDDSIVFSSRNESGLYRVPPSGGKPEVLTTYDRKREESSHRLPHHLPDGRSVLFTVTRHAWDMHPRVAVWESAKRDWRYLLEDAADARYVSTGHIVFLRQGSLMVVPFDPDRLVLSGEPVLVIPDVMQALKTGDSGTNTGAGQFSISDSGWLAFAPGGISPEEENSLVWLDRKGVEQPITSFRCKYVFPHLSPDGQRILYQSGSRLWVYDIDRGTASPLTSEGWLGHAIWAPDGKRVTFNWMKWWMPNIYWLPADGSSPPERLTTSDFYQELGSWSPDGRTLAFAESSLESNFDILLLDLPSRRVRPFLSSAFIEADPAFSPDGRWLAYDGDESGRWEVYLRAFPGAGSKWQISNEGGYYPMWARNGRQLFYRWKDQVWIVDVQTGTTFSAGKPRLLLEQPGYGMFFDVSPDGQRLLMVKLDERKPQPVTEMILVQNWFEELKRLCAAGK